MSSTMHGRGRARLELVRPANVVTAFADVLAGFAIAGAANWPALAPLLVSTACLYAGGTVLNDVFDRAIDAIERPERPIPSGRIGAREAGILGASLLVAGAAMAALAGRAAGIVAAFIVLAVLTYDARAKRGVVSGPLVMGACRGLNLLLGVAAVPSLLAARWPLALVNVAYIAGVTLTSRGEVSGGRRPAAAAAIVLVAGACAGLAAVGVRQHSVFAVLLTAALSGRVLPAFWRAWRDARPAAIRGAVRTGVLSLVLIDAALGAAYAGMIYGLAILAVALAAGRLARRFAVT
jgi:4-hydroxybenzoate polyprenyltransferase